MHPLDAPRASPVPPRARAPRAPPHAAKGPRVPPAWPAAPSAARQALARQAPVTHFPQLHQSDSATGRATATIPGLVARRVPGKDIISAMR